MTAHLFTDDPGWASTFLHPFEIGPFQRAARGEAETPLVGRLLGGAFEVEAGPLPQGFPRWPLILRREAPESQFDALLALARTGVPLPSVVVTVAGSGSGFHGSAGRPWVALEGNLHACVLFTFARPQPLPLPLLTPFVVNAMADTVAALPGLQRRVGIKWVNDLLVDGQKVGGALAATLTQGGKVSTLLVGAGLNVAQIPQVDRALYTPPAGALAALSSGPDGGPPPRVGNVLADFLSRLDGDFQRMLADPTGAAGEILSRYQRRSLILGEEVEVREDGEGHAVPSAHVLARGRVRSIGPGLELHLEGHPTPVTRGRLLWPLPGDASDG